MSRRLQRKLLLIGVFAAACAFYVPLRPHCLMGDDFTAFQMIEQAHLRGLWRIAFLENATGWFRPASLIFITLRAKLHGADAELYFYGNLALALVTSACLSRLAALQSRSLLTGVALALFLLFHQSQFYLLIGLGGMDLAGNLVFLGFLALLLRFLKSRRPAHFLAACGALAGALLFRENLVAAGPALACAAILAAPTQPEGRRQRWALAAVAIALTAGFAAARAAYLGPHAMEIPGAHLAFDVGKILRSYGIFLMDLPGVYFNESWFTGIDASDVSRPMQIAQAAFVVAMIALHVAWFSSKRVALQFKLESAVLAGMALALLGPPALIHKHDPRYVEPSLMCWMLMLARMRPAWASRRAAVAVATTAFTAYALLAGAYFRKQIPNLYFRQSEQIAGRVKAVTIDRYGSSLRGMEIAMPSSMNLDYSVGWGWLFRAYLNIPPSQLLHYQKLEDLKLAPGKPHLVLSCPGEICKDVTSAFDAAADSARMRFDLIAAFPQGEISPKLEAPVTTPTGQGVFPGVFGEDAGAKHALTVLSGFQYRSGAITAEATDRLCIRYRIPFVQSDGAGLRIEAETAGGKRLMLADDAALKPDDWSRRCIELAAVSGAPVHFKLTVYSPSGDMTADWVTVTELAVLRAQ
jgi:hypothetical protein